MDGCAQLNELRAGVAIDDADHSRAGRERVCFSPRLGLYQRRLHAPERLDPGHKRRQKKAGDVLDPRRRLYRRVIGGIALV